MSAACHLTHPLPHLSYFKFRISSVLRTVDKHHVSPRDFSVFVKRKDFYKPAKQTQKPHSMTPKCPSCSPPSPQGLPPHTTPEDIRDFFSDLYDLSKEGWTFNGWWCCRIRKRAKGAKPLPALKPVKDVSNTGDTQYAGSWVAEVSIAYRNGDTLRRYAKMDKLVNKVLEAKYAIQRYDEGSEHANEKKCLRAHVKARELEKKLELLQKLHKNVNIESNEVVGAFVTFNNAESASRCLADYKSSNSSVWRSFQPTPLRFGKKRNVPLVVKPCPEPSDVLWENIETSRRSKCLRRTLTNTVLIILLILSFLLILVAQRQKSAFTSELPALSACDTEVPALAYGTYDFPEGVSLRRQRPRDTTCGAGKYYLEWYDPEDDLGGGLAGKAGTCTDNCVSPVDTELCDQLDGVKAFRGSTVVACYCLNVLKAAINEHGVFKGPQVASDSDGDMCTDSAKNFLIAQALFLVAALSVVIVNVVLQRVLKALARFERHDTVSSESSAMAFKIFLAQLLNTGIIVLLVHARLPNAQQFPIQGVGLFEGDHDGFGPQWYPTVGVSIMLTMMLQSFIPHLMPLLKTTCLLPCKRCCKRRKALSQDALNRLYTPMKWDLAQRYPFLLNAFWVTMLYYAGLPLLLPIALVSFVLSYWIDKCFCMVYQHKQDVKLAAQWFLTCCVFVCWWHHTQCCAVLEFRPTMTSLWLCVPLACSPMLSSSTSVSPYGCLVTMRSSSR